MCPGVYCALASFSVLMRTAAFVSAGQTDETPAAVVASAPELQGRSHPSYQVFAIKTPLPQIRAVGSDTLLVGTNQLLSMSSSGPEHSSQQSAVADLLGISPRCLEMLVQDLSTNGFRDEELAREFRTAVIDYRYLLERWNRYHPGPENVPVKSEALKCLDTGDIKRAWHLFMQLPRPQPPGGLRAKKLSSSTNDVVSSSAKG